MNDIFEKQQHQQTDVTELQCWLQWHGASVGFESEADDDKKVLESKDSDATLMVREGHDGTHLTKTSRNTF